MLYMLLSCVLTVYYYYYYSSRCICCITVCQERALLHQEAAETQTIRKMLLQFLLDWIIKTK